MKQIEKLTIDSAERNWDMANVRDMLYALIDAHNSQAGEEKEETCEICGKPLKKCGEIAKKRARDEEVKQDPIDVVSLLVEYAELYSSLEKRQDSPGRMNRIVHIIKSAIRQ